MKAYYLCPKDIALVSAQHFYTFHYIDLPDGSVLLSGEAEEIGHANFQRHCTVEALPDVYDPDPIAHKHADRLAHMGIKRGHRTKHVRDAARKIHKLM